MVDQTAKLHNLSQYWEEIIQGGRWLYEKGLIAGGEGNLSLRLPDGNLLVTPSRLCKGKLQHRDAILLSPKGEVLAGEREPSSELLLHLHIYRLRSDVQAIVHAHPPFATGFAAAGLSLSQPLLAEMVMQFHAVPLLPYANPGTPELAEAITPYLEDHDAFLLSNHGVLTVGVDLQSAYLRMEFVEHCAKVVLVTYLLGKRSPIPGKDLLRLRKMWEENRFKPLPGVVKTKKTRTLLQDLFEELITRYLP